MMEISRVRALFFSPTGTTGRTAHTIAEALSRFLEVPLQSDDLTRPSERAKDYSFTASQLAVVALPTYAGRLPNRIAPDLRAHLYGNGALAVPVVLFGNRSFDNSLAELSALLTERGFCPVAAAAFAGRHAFTDKLGWGRPDWNDRREMESFAGAVSEKVKALTEQPAPVSVPGDPEAPYYVPRGTDGEPAKFLKAKPKTDLSRCSGCGTCARLCPMGAIDAREVSSVPGTCIKCQSCIRRCTRHARYFDDPAFLSHVAMLEREFAEPKENRTFL